MAKEKLTGRKRNTPERPNLFLPDPLNGEGFKLPKPPNYEFLSKVNFDGDGAAGAPPAGSGSGNDDLDLLPYFDGLSKTHQCRICDGRTTVTAFVSKLKERANINCPLCLGKGVLSGLRKPKDGEDEEVVELLQSLMFDIQTPLVLEIGRLVTVCLKRLAKESADSRDHLNPTEVTFLISAVSTRKRDRAKLVLGLDHEFTVLSDQLLITSEAQREGDLILTVRGLKTGFESLRLEARLRRQSLIFGGTPVRGGFERIRGLIQKISPWQFGWKKEDESRDNGH